MFATQAPPLPPPLPPAATFQGFNTFGAPGSSHQCQYKYTHAPMHSSPLAMSSTSSSPFATQQQWQQAQPASFFFQPQQHQPQPQSQEEQSSSRPVSHYAARYANTIANPLASRRNGGNTMASSRGARSASGATSPEARAHRRTLFLNRIKQDRDAGRFEARGEQLVLMEDVAEERRRRESMARRAERIMAGFGIDEEEQGREWDEGMFFLFSLFLLLSFLRLLSDEWMLTG